jgi:hypothetical protein
MRANLRRVGASVKGRRRVSQRCNVIALGSSHLRLPRETREAICDALGHEAARRGLDENEMRNDYGRQLDQLIAALGLDESP